MILFTVIGGYLGAGKTTLLNNILQNSQDRRIALLINDFGEINIDAGLIKSQTEAQINLTNGCVCCSLSDGFHEAIEQLASASFPPQHIIVEASGVADIFNLSQYGYSPQMTLDGVVIVADAETVVAKANDKYVAQTVRRQLAAADLIVLNKIDLVTRDKVKDVTKWLTENFPAATIIEAEAGRVPSALLLGIHDKHADPGNLDPGHHAHEQYSTWHFHSGHTVTNNSLTEFVAQLDESVVRAKGFALLEGGTCVQFQLVGSRREISPYPSPAEGISVVAIGLRGVLDLAALDKLADELFPEPG